MENTDAHPARPTLLWPVIAGLAFIGLAWVSKQLDEPTTRASYVWFASAVSIATLYLAPFSRWPAYMIALGAGAIAFNLIAQEPWLIVTTFAINELLSSAIAAWLLKLAIRGGRLDSIGHVLAFIFFGAFGGALLSALGGACIIATIEGRHFWTEWRVWLVANCVGTLVIAPLIIEWSNFRVRRSGGMNRSTFATGTALFALLLLSAMFVFDVRTLERFSGTVGLALTYLPLPFLVLTAIAWGVRGGTLAVFTLAAVAILNTHQGDGPFAAQDVIPGESLVEVQLYVAALALMTLLMSALRASQMRALKEAADWRLRYETAITSNRNVIFELDPRNHHLIWGGDTRAIIGVDPKDLKTFDQWLAHAHVEDQTRVRLAFDAIASGATATAALHYRAIGADGNVHHLEISATAVVDFDEQIDRISGLIREMPDPSGYNSAAQA